MCSSDLNGSISEILVFDSKLSDQELIAINHYLSKKWGLTSDVDSDSDGSMDVEDVFPMNPTKSNIFVEVVDNAIGSESGLDAVEANLQLWLDASNVNGDDNTGISDGQTVDTWKDLSGNGRNLSSSGSPALNTSGFNGKDSIYFDGIQDYFIANDIGNGILGGKDEFSIFMVFNMNYVLGTEDQQMTLALYDTGNWDNGGLYSNLYVHSDTSVFGFARADEDGGANRLLSTTVSPNHIAKIPVIVEFKKTPFVKSSIKINNVTHTYISQQNFDEILSNSNTDIVFGSNGQTTGSGGQFFDGNAAEIIVFDTAVTDEQNTEIGRAHV